jgi:hypothetical protein
VENLSEKLSVWHRCVRIYLQQGKRAGGSEKEIESKREREKERERKIEKEREESPFSLFKK